MSVISEGTLDPKDLFIACMREIQRQMDEGIIPVFPEIFVEGEHLYRDNGPWDDEDVEEAEELLEELFEYLNESAPDGCYFGAHPDDGACFGYWDFEEE